jgi:hypothetical protein
VSGLFPVLILAVFLGVAAGNLYAAPIIGGASIIGLLIVPCFPITSALTGLQWQFLRGALIATLAWPICWLWQRAHRIGVTDPSVALCLVQYLAILCGTQIAAAISRSQRRRQQDDAGSDNG